MLGERPRRLGEEAFIAILGECEEKISVWRPPMGGRLQKDRSKPRLKKSYSGSTPQTRTTAESGGANPTPTSGPSQRRRGHSRAWSEFSGGNLSGKSVRKMRNRLAGGFTVFHAKESQKWKGMVPAKKESVPGRG